MGSRCRFERRQLHMVVEAMKVCKIRMEPRERNSFEAGKERIWGGG